MTEKVEKKKIKLLNDRKRAREIVDEILNFGVNDDQIHHIIFLLALNLENNQEMKELTSLSKKFTENINTENDSGNIIKDEPSKIILN